SDIHIEIFEEFVLVRYRVDGILREVLRISREIHLAVVARIKLLAGLKIDEHYRPQDGRFRVKVGVEALDIRVSVLPTYYGEKIVMRLLAGAARPLALREVGMLEDTEKVLLDNMRRTYGMVLICGPTGSGKTTTLYSMLNLLNRPEVNIVTVEDPIEYDIKYVNQTQVNAQAGITFANGLRAILRQDPNVILIGEVRDDETASIAVQAALTGHLLLSSLHTNDAPTAVPRLIDMGVPPFLVSAVLNAVASQRLVRRICSQCIYSMAPSREALAAIERQLVELKVPDYKLPRLVYAGKGCPACGGTGYRGRLGIFEVLNVTEEVRSLITSSRFSLDLLREIARKEGMIGIFEDGLRKVERGLTTVEELIRVVKE
ncbi:MAG: type II/IV secretion system protein, partial [Candidatus Colwellbacteria bacterium]|nr:type II/IV secretion system protein [Candidatus Colwellbacteria bacterium]